jgi:hypothetical protein
MCRFKFDYLSVRVNADIAMAATTTMIDKSIFQIG